MTHASRTGLLGAAAGLAMGAAMLTSQGAAAAVLVTGAPSTYSLAFSTTENGATLSATGTLSITSLTATTMQVAVTLNNTTNSVGTNRITAFGFEIDPGTVTGATTPTPSWGANFNDNISGGFNSIDVCAFDTNSCNAAAPGSEGIFEGTSESVLLNITGSFTTPFTITDVVVRFTSVGTGDQGSIAFPGTIRPPSDIPVPEPLGLALLGTGLLGLGLARRIARRS